MLARLQVCVWGGERKLNQRSTWGVPQTRKRDRCVECANLAGLICKLHNLRSNDHHCLVCGSPIFRSNGGQCPPIRSARRVRMASNKAKLASMSHVALCPLATLPAEGVANRVAVALSVQGPIAGFVTVLLLVLTTLAPTASLGLAMLLFHRLGVLLLFLRPKWRSAAGTPASLAAGCGSLAPMLSRSRKI